MEMVLNNIQSQINFDYDKVTRFKFELLEMSQKREAFDNSQHIISHLYDKLYHHYLSRLDECETLLLDISDHQNTTLDKSCFTSFWDRISNFLKELMCCRNHKLKINREIDEQFGLLTQIHNIRNKLITHHLRCINRGDTWQERSINLKRKRSQSRSTKAKRTKIIKTHDKKNDLKLTRYFIKYKTYPYYQITSFSRMLNLLSDGDDDVFV